MSVYTYIYMYMPYVNIYMCNADKSFAGGLNHSRPSDGRVMFWEFLTVAEGQSLFSSSLSTYRFRLTDTAPTGVVWAASCGLLRTANWKKNVMDYFPVKENIVFSVMAAITCWCMLPEVMKSQRFHHQSLQPRHSSSRWHWRVSVPGWQGGCTFSPTFIWHGKQK